MNAALLHLDTDHELSQGLDEYHSVLFCIHITRQISHWVIPGWYMGRNARN